MIFIDINKIGFDYGKYKNIFLKCFILIYNKTMKYKMTYVKTYRKQETFSENIKLYAFYSIRVFLGNYNHT